MSGRYRVAIVIESDAKNTVEQFISTIQKRADRGSREFGVDISVRRVGLETMDVEGFDG